MEAKGRETNEKDTSVTMLSVAFEKQDDNKQTETNKTSSYVWFCSELRASR